ELRVRLARPVPRRAVDDGDEHFVDDVFGERKRAAHVRGEPGDGGVMTAVEIREGVAIAFRDSGDQQVVRQVVGAHILYSAGRGKGSGTRVTAGISSRRCGHSRGNGRTWFPRRCPRRMPGGSGRATSCRPRRGTRTGTRGFRWAARAR